MKLFRNKQTGEMYLCLTYSESALSLISMNDETWTMVTGNAMDNYEKVSTAPTRLEPVAMKFEFRQTEEIMLKEIQDNLNSDEPLGDTFSIGDILYVPVQGYESPIPFEIVHVSEDTRSLYFMSRDILERMPITEVDEWLETFKKKLPTELVDCLKQIEHINVSGTHGRLLSLPSVKNMGRDEDQCSGVDDIKFDKFKYGASRCKNFDGVTEWYWTDTPSATSADYFWNVTSGGNPNGSTADNSFGVCICFKLSKGK